jgi:hypothetical protein
MDRLLSPFAGLVATLPVTLTIALGCGGSPSAADGSVRTIDAGHHEGSPIIGLTAVQSPDNVLAYTVEFTSPVAGKPRLDVVCEGLDPWSIEGEADATDHEVFVMGLAPNISCTLTASLAGNADVAPAAIEIDVASLPDFLPAPSVAVAATGAAQDGWTLINLGKDSGSISYTVALIDMEGRYRWYYQYPGAWRGADSPVTRFGSGVLVGGRGIPITEVSWDGRQVWSGPTGHHEVRPSLVPGRVYYLTDEAPCNGQMNGAGGIVEWDYRTSSESWHWYLCNHYDPPVDVPDWSHLNTIAHTHDDGTLLVSSRNQNAIFWVDRESGDILWTMGYAGRISDGFNGDFEMAEEDRFIGQHDPEVLPNGNILMYDNGDDSTRPYSRALEIAYTYDPSGVSSAHMVWEYRHHPDLFTPVWGSADRLDNGNTLVTFGRADGVDVTHIVEVTHDKEVVWELTLPLHWGTYRSERVIELPRGFVRE